MSDDMILQGDMQILPHRQRLEDARCLQLDADSLRDAGKGLGMRDVGAPEHNPPLGGRVGSDHKLEQRALAGTIRPDETMHLARPYRKVNVSHGEHTTEALAGTCDFEKCRHLSLPPPMARAGRRAFSAAGG